MCRILGFDYEAIAGQTPSWKSLYEVVEKQMGQKIPPYIPNELCFEISAFFPQIGVSLSVALRPANRTDNVTATHQYYMHSAVSPC